MRSFFNLLLFFVHLFFLISFFHPHVTHSSSSSSSSVQPFCHNDESYALFQFKESFIIDLSASLEPSAYPKVSSWKLNGENDDCCSWDGVECDEQTGHVIGLNLGSSCLSGSFNTNSTLFNLSHLRKLSLSDNYFNHSEIPLGFGHLTELKYLDLSDSFFSGQIPSEISNLSNLVSLSLKWNSLKLQEPLMKSLVHNLMHLKELDLGYLKMNFTVLEPLTNKTSLTYLGLQGCSLQGIFPTGIFHLPNLKTLNLANNIDLRGKLPEFRSSSPLQVIDLSATSFYGELPLSIGNLHSLEEFCILDCNFRGNIPSSFENLTQLKVLQLSYNNFSVQTLSSLPFFGKHTQLISLKLDGINLHGEIPSSIARLINLEYLSLHENQIVGSIPSNLMKLTHLKFLDLSSNKLEGLIPNSISDLKNIEKLFLQSNNLSGLVRLEMFLMLKHLTALILSFNNLKVLTSNVITNSFLLDLGLASCNLDSFPSFLNNLDQLLWLDLSHNHINGQIPKSLSNSSVNTLMFLNLSYNSITSFDQPSVFLPWKYLYTLDLSFNMLKGSLPIPPPSIYIYLASNNRLVGEISSLICTLGDLVVLDLSNNNLSGVLPHCLGNFSNSLEVVNLQNNSLSSHIPPTFTEECKLKFVDLSHNQLHSEVPRSLVNCTKLEFLDLGNNYINDIFPSWLGTLTVLTVLSLNSNEFHGEVGNPVIGSDFEHFPNIHIIDISHNNFRGKLPSLYFQTWEALKIIDANQATYMREFSYPVYYVMTEMYSVNEYHYTLTIHNKGMGRLYPKISNALKAIDLSYNKFQGEIATSIGNLKGLQLLDFSNNDLSGHIPSCLRDLKELESLELSSNKLSGHIPQELNQLNFLEFFNVSHNHLTGLIPRGGQFDTFQNYSYEGNVGLCGTPLSKPGGNTETSSRAPSTTFVKNQNFSSQDDFVWKIVAAMGFGSGLVVGVIIECHKMFIKNWFVRTFTRQPFKRRISSEERKEGENVARNREQIQGS